MRLLIRPLAFLTLFAIGAIGWWFLVQQDRQVFGAISAGQQTTDWPAAVLGYAATLFGVTLGAFYRELSGEKSIADFHVFLRRAVRSTDLWAGYCASPLVCGLVLLATSGVTLAGLVVIALQNGFFCHVVIKRLLPAE